MFEHGRRGTSNILYLWPMLALVGRSSTLKFQNQFSNWNLSSGWKGNWSEGLVKRQTTSSIPTLLELCLLIIFQHKYAARLGCMERGMKTLNARMDIHWALFKMSLLKLYFKVCCDFQLWSNLFIFAFY